MQLLCSSLYVKVERNKISLKGNNLRILEFWKIILATLMFCTILNYEVIFRDFWAYTCSTIWTFYTCISYFIFNTNNHQSIVYKVEIKCLLMTFVSNLDYPSIISETHIPLLLHGVVFLGYNHPSNSRMKEKLKLKWKQKS